MRRRAPAELYDGSASETGPLPHTLVVLTHPARVRSRVNAAGCAAAKTLPDLSRHDPARAA